MRLKNKKTGEIVNGGFVLTNYDGIAGNPQHSLAELNDEWEDVPEEPKEYWYLSGNSEIRRTEDNGVKFDRYHKEVGNYFSSREEAEKAIEKLKAWKRLKDKGFEINDWAVADNYEIRLFGHYSRAGIKDELDLLFRGEE